MLTQKSANAVRLAAVSRIAASMGLAPGLTLADARARIPNLIAAEAAPDSDSHMLSRLATWCDRFTPLVAMDGHDGLLLDVTGCVGLFGGEAGLRNATIMGMKRLGFSVKASLAGTPDAASALARFGSTAIVPEGDDARATSGLPLVALMAGEEATRALRRAGFRTLGDLTKRSPAALRARFDAALMRRLRRISGEEETRLTPLRPEPVCRATRRFAEPLSDAGALEAILKALLESAATDLERRGEGGLGFEAGFFRADGDVRRLAVETGRPSRDTALVLKLFAERMSALADPIDPGFGFDAMTLSVLRTAPLNPAQSDLMRRQRESGLADLVDRLIARFGPDRVQRFVPEDTHMPERAVQSVPAVMTRGRETWPSPEPGEPPARPLHMFDPPQPIDVPVAQFPDGPPGRFRWRRVMHDVTAAEGPERIAPEWWRVGEETLTRDYFRVEDSTGRRFWIYRRGLYGRETREPVWYLHGLFA